MVMTDDNAVNFDADTPSIVSGYPMSLAHLLDARGDRESWSLQCFCYGQDGEPAAEVLLADRACTLLETCIECTEDPDFVGPEGELPFFWRHERQHIISHRDGSPCVLVHGGCTMAVALYSPEHDGWADELVASVGPGLYLVKAAQGPDGVVYGADPMRVTE